MTKTGEDLDARLSRLEKEVAEVESSLPGNPPVICAYAFGVERNGQIAASLVAGPDSGVYFGFAEGAISPTIVFGLAANGSPFLAASDARRVKRLAIEMSTNGWPSVQLRDAKGTPRVRIEVDPRGSPSVGGCDANGIPAVGIVVNAKGEPGIAIRKGANG